MRIVLLDDFLEDWEKLKLYFDKESPELRETFDRMVREGLNRILDFPKVNHRVRQNYRICQLKKFRRHGILYRIKRNVIFIHGVFHLQRGLSFWKDRLS